MTLKELHSEICTLGFDSHLPFDQRLLSSVYRSLELVYSSKKITKSTKFFVRSCLPKTKLNEMHHHGGGVETLPLSGKAYSMRLYGEGVILLGNSKKEIMHEFNCDGDYFKGFLDGGETVSFYGDLSYTVCNLVTFDEIYSLDPNDIPDGNECSIVDMRKLVPDFLAFDSLPTDSSGELITDAVLCDGKISFCADFSGEVSLVYRKRALMPSLDTPDARIDVPDELAHLLPLMAAFFILLDDEPEKAAIYREMFDKALAKSERVKAEMNTARYLDTNGWS